MVKGTLSLVGLVLGIITAIVLGLNGWHISQDIYGWKDRAQVSNEPHDMAEYMTNVKVGMEKWGVTDGNSALFFPTPSTDMGMIYRAVQQHVDQAKVLETMNRASPEYQTGLDNLRGSIRELTIPAYDYWANHQALTISLLCWAGWIMFIGFGLWWLFTDAM